MTLPKERVLFLSSVLLTVLILIGAGMIGYNASTIRHAEDIEEDASKLLFNAEQWLDHQQEIEVAIRSYVYIGDEERLRLIEERRRELAEHEQAIKEVLNAYVEGGDYRLKGLLEFSNRHQRKIDGIVAAKKAGDDSTAERRLKEADSDLFIYGAKRILDSLTQEIQEKRIEANAQVSINALRESISFGLMAALMIAIVWISYVVTARTQRRNLELSEQLALKATHDALTGLPNRDLFYDRLSQAIFLARRKRQHLGVLYLDLDGFKAVNDIHGHQVGDATLKETARRLRACVRDADTVARLGGDEFAIVLNEIKTSEDVRHIAEKIIATIDLPMQLYGDRTYGIGVSIGIAIYPDCGVEIDRLVKAADDAMYESKMRGKNCFTYSTEHAAASAATGDWVSFLDDFQVGISMIDEQHQMLGDMLNKLNMAVAMQTPQEMLARQLDEIIAYADFHFRAEEQLMDEHRYPEATAHREEHRRLNGEVKYLKTRFAEGGELVVLQWLKDWLVGHVAGSDRRLSEYLLKCGVK